MKKLYLFLLAAIVSLASFAAEPQKVAPTKSILNKQQLAKPKAHPMLKGAPNNLGGNFSDWEFLGTGTFNAELGMVDPCPVNVYYCTTDPYGMGVDSWAIEGVFGDYIRVAGMPFIEYYNINNIETGLAYDGQAVSIDELSNHYDIGMATSYDATKGIFSLAMLYYVLDPDVVDNVVTYGIETVQLDGEFFDYDVNLEVAGETTDGQNLKTKVTFADAANVKVKAYAGEYEVDEWGDPGEELAALIETQADDASIKPLEESQAIYFPLTENATYTVVVTYTEGADGPAGYSFDSYTFDKDWEDCGSADLTDDYLASYYTDFPIKTATGLRLQKHKDIEKYRIVNPYTTDDTWTSEWSKLVPYDTEVNSFFVIDAQRPDKVFIEINPADITDGDGIRLVLGSAAHYNIINNRTDEQITEKGYWGTIEYTDDRSTATVTFPTTVLMMRQITSPYPLFAGFNDAFKCVMHFGTVGIDNIATDNADAPAEYFNLQGVKVANPEGGIFIMRKGGKASKVYVK